MTSDEAYIANECDAAFVKIIPWDDSAKPPAIGICATYTVKPTECYVHREPTPVRVGWEERAISNLLDLRAKAMKRA